MKNLVGLAGVGLGGLFLASCVTYPYDTAFNSCEREANSCYRLCEDIPDEGGYVACQRHCDRDIDRCFDQAYTPYSGNYYYGSSYPSPWYGRYGSWYPNTGYYFTYNHYDRYGYRKNKRRHWNGDRDWRNNGGRDHGGRDRHDPRNDNPVTPPRQGSPNDAEPNRPTRGRPGSGPRRQFEGDRMIDRPRRLERRYRNNSGAANPAAPAPSRVQRPSAPAASRPPRRPPPVAAPNPQAPPTREASPPPSNDNSAPRRDHPPRGARRNTGGRNNQTPDRDRD
ncbi:MAG: hypothetical protein KDD85_05285 [Parvularculaceae bacterium]|nr:hypothetical protein [Parvularculaceae bacterium]